MSRIRIMNPKMPPPVPYCIGVPVVVTVSSARGAAKARAARQSWRNMEKAALIMVTAGIFERNVSVQEMSIDSNKEATFLLSIDVMN